MIAVEARKEALRVRWHFWISTAAVNRWFEGRRIFFVLAMGRSGTKFLSHLLRQSPGVIVEHEPVLNDIYALRRAYFHPPSAPDYVARFRKKEMCLRLRSRPFAAYGEVNSLLRRHSAALQRSFPDAPLIHLVRDGRDVVRSLMARPTLAAGNPYDGWVRPVPADPYAAQWDTMSRFEKVCWYWQEENRFLRSSIGGAVLFEKLLHDYDYFAQAVLQPLGLDIPMATWQAQVQRPANETRDFQMPPWREWEAGQTEAFWRICGVEMRAYGYEG